MAREKIKTDAKALVPGLISTLSELERFMARQSERFRAFIEIGAEISRARNVDDLLATLMERLTKILDAEAATLFLYDEATDELWSLVLRGTALKEIRFPSSRGIAGHVFHSGKTLLLGDAYSDIHFHPEVDKKTGFRTRSVIAAPLLHMSGKPQGVVQVLDRRVDAFSREDQFLVEGVAVQVAGVLNHVLLSKELRKRGEELARRVEDLDVLLEVEQSISSSTQQVDIADRILINAIQAIEAQAGSVLLTRDNGDKLYFRAAHGEKTTQLHSMELRKGQGIAGYVASSGHIVRVHDANTNAHFDRLLAKKLGYPIGAVLCVPISLQGSHFGALELLNKTEGFTASDERLAVLLAGQLGRALVQLQTREEATQKARLATIGQLMTGVMHDLRTPLTVISGYAEMMAEESSIDSRKQMSQIIREQLDNISTMQKETLAFARGETTIFLRKVSLHTFMKNLKEQLAYDFADTQIKFRVRVGYAGPACFDEHKMRRALLNISHNALEAMPKGGNFTILVHRAGDELVFRARDNGPCIPPEIADTLFEPFRTYGKPQGTGLGLAIVHNIIKEHGGRITFKTQIGRGTTFELRIPARVPMG